DHDGGDDRQDRSGIYQLPFRGEQTDHAIDRHVDGPGGRGVQEDEGHEEVVPEVQRLDDHERTGDGHENREDDQADCAQPAASSTSVGTFLRKLLYRSTPKEAAPPRCTRITLVSVL